MKQIKLIPVNHRGNSQLFVKFAIDNELLTILRKIPDAKWSRTHTSWYVANNPENLKLIYCLFEGVAVIEPDYKSQPDYKSLKDFCNLDSLQTIVNGHKSIVNGQESGSGSSSGSGSGGGSGSTTIRRTTWSRPTNSADGGNGSLCDFAVLREPTNTNASGDAPKQRKRIEIVCYQKNY